MLVTIIFSFPTMFFTLSKTEIVFFFFLGGGAKFILSSAHALDLVESKFLSFGKELTHSLKNHFESVPNSKTLQATTEMWLLKNSKIQITQKTLWKNVKLLQNEQFHLFPQCFPKVFSFYVLKWVYMVERVKKVNSLDTIVSHLSFACSF